MIVTEIPFLNSVIVFLKCSVTTERITVLTHRSAIFSKLPVSATRFADIEDFVKNQMGKEDKDKQQWRKLGDDVLKGLKELRDKTCELDADPNNQMALRLRFARGWVRAVVSQYLYRVARDQMEGTS